MKLNLELSKGVVGITNGKPGTHMYIGYPTFICTALNSLCWRTCVVFDFVVTGVYRWRVGRAEGRPGQKYQDRLGPPTVSKSGSLQDSIFLLSRTYSTQTKKGRACCLDYLCYKENKRSQCGQLKMLSHITLFSMVTLVL